MPSNPARLTTAKRSVIRTDKRVDALPRGSAKQAGSSILVGTVANINGFLANPDLPRLWEYERAFTTDETIASAIDFVQLSLIASMGEYQHPNQAIQRFVRENLDNMEGNFRQALGEMVLSAMWAGFATSEMIWTVDGSALWLERMANYHPGSIYIAVDKNGYLKEGGEPMMPGSKEPGIYQLAPMKGYGTYLQLPMNKICLLTHRRRHNNYYGESIIRRVYKSWKYKDPAMEMWAIALDRYGTPVVYAVVPHMPTGREIADPYAEGGKRIESMADSAAYAISNIHMGTGLVLEQPDPENKLEIGTLTTGNNYGTSFENFIANLDRSIYRGLLIPQLVFNEGRGGMNSTAKTHFDVYKLMLKSLYSQFVEPFTEQVIGRLIRYNFNETNPGTFPMLPFDPTTAETLANMLDKMVNTGMINPADINDLNMVRQVIGLPSRDDIVIDDIARVVRDHKLDDQTKIKVAKVRADAMKSVAELKVESTEEITDTNNEHQLKVAKISAEAQKEAAKHQAKAAAKEPKAPAKPVKKKASE